MEDVKEASVEERNEELTEKRALELYRDLWAWMSNNPGNLKHRWFELQGLGPFHSDCPCCEYVLREMSGLDFHAMYCARGSQPKSVAMCPMNDLWPEGCLSGNSPYAE